MRKKILLHLTMYLPFPEIFIPLSWSRFSSGIIFLQPEKLTLKCILVHVWCGQILTDGDYRKISLYHLNYFLGQHFIIKNSKHSKVKRIVQYTYILQLTFGPVFVLSRIYPSYNLVINPSYYFDAFQSKLQMWVSFIPKSFSMYIIN